jgi:hypothetical protein
MNRAESVRKAFEIGSFVALAHKQGAQWTEKRKVDTLCDEKPRAYVMVCSLKVSADTFFVSVLPILNRQLL